MFFLSTAFCSDSHSLSATPTGVSKITSVTIKNAAYDDLYIQAGVDAQPNFDLPVDWDYHIILYARFKNNLLAGNIDAFLSQTTALRLKRRERGSFRWTTLLDHPNDTGSVNDLMFEYHDRLARSGTEYDYALLPILNNVEGAMSVATVKSEFDGICLLDAKEIYYTDMEINVDVQRNAQSSAVTPLDSRYPFIIHNGRANYASGEASALFLLRDFVTKNCPPNLDGGYVHREWLMDFLCNGKTKILKLYDGRMWMVDIEGSPGESHTEHENKVITSFSWIETGDCEDAYDLFYRGFIDYRPTSN